MGNRNPSRRIIARYPGADPALIRDIHAQGGHLGGRISETYTGGDNGTPVGTGLTYRGVWCAVCGAQLSRLVL